MFTIWEKTDFESSKRKCKSFNGIVKRQLLQRTMKTKRSLVRFWSWCMKNSNTPVNTIEKLKTAINGSHHILTLIPIIAEPKNNIILLSVLYNLSF